MSRIISFEIDDALDKRFILALLSAEENEDDFFRKMIQSFSASQLKRDVKEVYRSSAKIPCISGIEHMKQIRGEMHQSWVNLRKAIYKRKGFPFSFGTPNVEASATHFLNRVINECNMTVDEILNYLENNALGY